MDFLWQGPPVVKPVPIKRADAQIHGYKSPGRSFHFAFLRVCGGAIVFAGGDAHMLGASSSDEEGADHVMGFMEGMPQDSDSDLDEYDMDDDDSNSDMDEVCAFSP